MTGIAATLSGAPFVEVMAEGISKAWGRARLCDRLGITAEEVLAFGDAPNDAELLAWAGRGVAVSNASPATLAAANEVSLSNEEDGVAVVLERLLASTEGPRERPIQRPNAGVGVASGAGSPSPAHPASTDPTSTDAASFVRRIDLS